MELPQLTGHLQINELYDESMPTYQGEGPYIGRPCFFIRTQHCPVKCRTASGICDSAMTWDGSEGGEKMELNVIATYISRCLERWPKAGFVITGGEPLLHYRNAEFKRLLGAVALKTWVSLETSGFTSATTLATDLKGKENLKHLFNFLDCFDSISLSPKVTPCLTGPDWTREELTTWIPHFIEYQNTLDPASMFLKFVAQDEPDFASIDWFMDRFPALERTPVYVMPFGIQPGEVIDGCKRVLPYCAKRGYTLSPRLHSILWGAERGR